MGQINYALFLVTVALLPFPQIFLRYACVTWIICWVLEGRFCKKPSKDDWKKSIPFLMFGVWYLLKIISGIWSKDVDLYEDDFLVCKTRISVVTDDLETLCRSCKTIL